MLVHMVLFWLPEELTDQQKEQFRAGLESLSQCEMAQALYVGTPAATPPRPVIDTTYDFALTVILEDIAAQNAYQEHPAHKKFVQDFSAWFKRVQVYDAE